MDWDLIPDIAIDKINLEGSNPVFGLNALGGSVNVQLKNGFTWQGFEADVSGGSFGQVEGEFQYGKQIGNASTYVAGTVLHQGGWRDLQSTDLQNIYGDVGWRSDRAELHLNVTAAHSVLNGPGTSPVELLAADPSAQFTAPNQITNQYAAVSLTGTVDVTDTTSVQALGVLPLSSCSGSPTATRRTTRPATTAPGCCASTEVPAPRWGAPSFPTS